MSFTPDSNSQKRRKPASSKKPGKNFKPRKKFNNNKHNSGWGSFLRRWFMNPDNYKDEYKNILKGCKWEVAKCSCKDKKGNTVPYVYCPATKYDPAGWFCPECGKGHLKTR